MAERNRSAVLQKLKFLKVYSVLKSELLRDPDFEFDEYSRRWVERMLDYFVPRGNLKKGLSVAKSYRHLKEGKEVTESEDFIASVLGWCIELLQAYVQALDAIIHEAQLPSDKPYRFELSKDAKVTANDGIFLRSYITRILIKHLKGKPYYADIVDLFNEVEFQMGSGNMIYLIATGYGEKDLSKYSMPLYRRMVQYKITYHSYYLPAACALLMSGEDLEDHIDAKKILVEMGIYFQVQDDYADCFGDPKKTRKVNSDSQLTTIGTDIQDFKCSWLVVKALELCNEEQKKVLTDHYGKDSPEAVAKVKALYYELNLQRAFVEYEAKAYQKLMASIESHPSKPVQALLKSFLSKGYKKLELDVIFSGLRIS
uniref:Farnesyl pyrophosphate synthase n=1 Tax=Kalanchoe fedtschenkoi TaxID=63787 RepID=A0A7N0UIV3_KALFE